MYPLQGPRQRPRVPCAVREDVILARWQRNRAQVLAQRAARLEMQAKDNNQAVEMQAKDSNQAVEMQAKDSNHAVAYCGKCECYLGLHDSCRCCAFPRRPLCKLPALCNLDLESDKENLVAAAAVSDKAEQHLPQSGKRPGAFEFSALALENFRRQQSTVFELP